MFGVGDLVRVVRLDVSLEGSRQAETLGKTGRVSGILKPPWPIIVKFTDGEVWCYDEDELAPAAICPFCGRL